MIRYPHHLTFLGILGVLAKLIGNLEYSWFIVLLPFWLPITLAIIFGTVGKGLK